MIHPDIQAKLLRSDMTKNGKPDRAWFERSVANSKRAIELGEEQFAKDCAAELDEMLDDLAKSTDNGFKEILEMLDKVEDDNK